MLRIRFSSSSSTICLSYSDHIFSWSQCYIGHTKHGINAASKPVNCQCKCFFHNFCKKIAPHFFRFFFRAARLGTAARGDDIHEAARNCDVPALRHFLRVAPEKVHEKDDIGPRPQEFAFFPKASLMLGFSFRF